MKSSSAEETKKLAADFIKNVQPQKNGATVVALFGDLGAGKTTFVQGVGEALGIQEAISSPTFLIMKGFRVQGSGFRKLIHMDCYRLKNIEELRVLGFEKLLEDPSNLIVIEWPERIAELLPASTCNIRFEHADDTVRNIVLG